MRVDQLSLKLGEKRASKVMNYICCQDYILWSTFVLQTVWL